MLDPFENELPDFSIPLCSIHNLPGIVVNPDRKDKDTLVLCLDCLTKHKKLDDYLKENQKIFRDIQSENKRKIDLLNPFLLSIHEFFDKITNSVNKIIALIKNQIDSIKQNQIKHNEIFSKSKCIDIETIIQRNETQKQQLHEFNEQITDQLKNIKQILDIDNLIQGFQIQNIGEETQKNQQLIAINSNNSIIAAANNNIIRIFQYQNEILKEIQELDDHEKTISYLTFMKKTEQFISACYDGTIILWEQTNDKQWRYYQILNEHKYRINCLQINQNEDLIISGSDDKTIKFWKKDQYLWCWLYVQTLQMEEKVFNLSLNESNNKLIASLDSQKSIKIIEYDGNQWQGTQTLELSLDTLQLCFINDNQFAIQLLRSNLLQIFNFDKENNQFKLGQEINVKYGEGDYNLFQMQFMRSLGLLINKNCQYINLLRKQQNGEFTLIQTIDYGHRSLYGCVTDDGSYLLTWDTISKQLQVRKFEMI